MDTRDILNFTRETLASELSKIGAPRYRVDQIFQWLYKRGATSFAQMGNLSPHVRERLREIFHIGRLRVKDKRISFDGTVKYLLQLEDSQTIETVYIPGKARATVCVSSQVGCRHGCRFCASTKAGLVRNLAVSEIVEQVMCLRADLRLPVTNLVFMGIGEPFDNYENTIQALRICNDPHAFGIGARKMTVSTCGIIPRIRQFAQEGLQVELSVSLHSARDDVRSRIVPINKRYPVRELIRSCKEYTRATGRVITFEYVLLKGVNVSGDDARLLARLLRGFTCKVNCIAYNAVAALGYEPPDREEIRGFIGILRTAGINVTLRKSKGQDIEAACGQLRIVQR